MMVMGARGARNVQHFEIHTRSERPQLRLAAGRAILIPSGNAISLDYLPMAQLDRRSVLSRLALVPAGLAVAGSDVAAQLGELFVTSADRALLQALAQVVLPAELGDARTLEMTERFERWVSNFRPGAELNHGYGTGTVQQAGADPWPGWRAQLQVLDAEARTQNAASFAALSVERRRVLVSAQLEAANAQRLPNPLSATHVALALLAWFYNSPDATDLCYRAAIGKETCRPLREAAQAPRSL
jgi:hypothetical protein